MHNNLPQETFQMHYIAPDFIQGTQMYDPALFSLYYNHVSCVTDQTWQTMKI